MPVFLPAAAGCSCRSGVDAFKLAVVQPGVEAALRQQGVVVALLACVLEKLGRVEEKLDKLLEEKERED